MDGECTWNDGTDQIAELIAEVAPDLIVTFGPDGMTGHPDHRAVTRGRPMRGAPHGRRPTSGTRRSRTDFHAQWGASSDHVGLWAEQPSPPCTADHDLAVPPHARQ